MFSDPFRPQSVAALQASPKEVPKRPKSPPKSSEEWILAQEEQNQTGLGNVRKQRDQEGALLTAAQAWPKRAPEGERLLGDAERKDKANMIFGSLESIKDDIQRHARTWTKLLRRGKLNSQFIVTARVDFQISQNFSDFRSNTVNIQAWAAPSRAL